MRRLLFSTLSVLAVLAAAACGDSPTQPAESVLQPPAISADERPPSMSGIVQRIVLGDGGAPPPALYDPNTNLSAMVGFNVEAFCQAGGPGVANPADYFEGDGLLSFVHAPGQGGLITIRGEGWLHFWNGPYVFANTCTHLIGGGPGKSTYAENATSPQNAGPNIANTFHFSARGAVQTADGTKQGLMKIWGRVKDGILQQLEIQVQLSN